MTAPGLPDGEDVPLVRISNVWKKRGANIVLKGVNLVAEHGKVMCLLGPSGAGKSTLLRCINAIELADRGMIYVDGVAIGCRQEGEKFIRLSEREVSRQRADIGMVFKIVNSGQVASSSAMSTAAGTTCSKLSSTNRSCRSRT